MLTILHLDSSVKSQGSVTRELSAHAVSVLRKTNPDARIIYHDLARDPLPALDGDFLASFFAPPSAAAEPENLARSNRLVDELISADILVIGTPMYNFGIPTQLKAWIDHITRAGRTFKYTPEGPVGLLTRKRVILAVASGGAYADGPMAPFDHVIPYMKHLLGFLGLTDITVARADKQSMGPEIAAGAMLAARETLDKTLGA